MELATVERIVERARRERRARLLEPEGLELLTALGLAVPTYEFIPLNGGLSAERLRRFASRDLVVKAVSLDIPHRTVVGGLRFVRRDATAVQAAIAEMSRDLAAFEIAGFTLHERVPFEPGPASELLFSLRWTREFGPVVCAGLGGAGAERLAARLRDGASLAIASPHLTGTGDWADALRGTLLGDLIGSGGHPRIAEVSAVYDRMRRAALALPADLLSEIEINPLVWASGEPVALDVLVDLPPTSPSIAAPRPVAKIRHLLEPRSIGIVGISRRRNPGRVILDNLLTDGFDPARLHVVKAGLDAIAGCAAVPDVASLPEKVDLLIVAVDARRSLEVVGEAIATDKAESFLLISGGLGERTGSDGLAAALRAALAEARRSRDGGPVLNGANCLGLRSQPGAIDTLFLPRHKLECAVGSGTALISQSGALLAALLSRDDTGFRYAISLGNQNDLTLGDYLEYLKGDAATRAVAVYVEGFQPLDGLRFLEAARELRQSDRPVLLYRGARRAAGARAAASHTASIAGDSDVARALSRAAGIVEADSLEELAGLIEIASRLTDRRAAGSRLAVVTNAGYECVAAADNLNGLELAPFGEATRTRLAEIFGRARLDGVVDVGNPLDLTPMAGDEAFAEAVAALVGDDSVDLAIVGCVPLTPALETLPASSAHGEDVLRPDAVAARLGRLWRSTDKPIVAVVDAGPAYEPFRRALREQGLPVLPSIDRATRLLARFVVATG